MALEFSWRGKPMDNALAVNLKDRFRDECLNVIGLLSLEDTKAKIEAWRRD